MIPMIEPIQTESLVEVFIERFEKMIISGQIQIGQKLPSERELAVKLDVSRPVVHEGLLYLSAKGLVTLKPRSGWMVNDYRKTGSLTLLNSLFKYGEGQLDKEVASSMLRMRLLVETEAATLSAENRTETDINNLEGIVRSEEILRNGDRIEMIKLDFEFHLCVCTASGNLVYPLLLNSCKAVYMNLTGIFFRNTGLYGQIVTNHRNLLEAVKSMDKDSAGKIMEKMLKDGEAELRSLL